MNKKTRMFDGFSSVFSFTLKNQMKGKGFVISTIVMPIILFVIFAAINIGVAYAGKEKEVLPMNVDVLFLLDETENDQFGDLFEFAGADETLKGVKRIVKRNQTVNEIAKSIKADASFADQNWAIMSLKIKEGVLEEHEDGSTSINKDRKGFVVTLVLPENSEINGDTQDTLLSVGTEVANMVTIANAQVSAEQYVLLNSNFLSQVLDAGEKENNFIVEMMKTVFPMLIVMVMYIMIIMYGQGMGKVVVSEKSSKLMEMMLTSIQPMALIAGKVFAMIAIALLQFFLWIIAAIVGFVVGDVIAKTIDPNYSNIVMTVIDVIREYGMQAFSVSGCILALLSLIFGFAQYCMFSALIASTCSKAEEVAERQGIYMIFIIAGYALSLLCGVGGDNLILICDIIPFSAAFRLPCDALLGIVPIWVSCISVVLMIAITVVFAILAGKVYRAQVFLRGQGMGDQMKKLIGFFSRFSKKQAETK